MGYYIRILSPFDEVPSLKSLVAELARSELAATVALESGTEDHWSQVLLSHNGGPEIAAIERSCRSSDGLVAAEIEEFLEEIADCKPSTAAAWLAEYLPLIRAIYHFQLLRGTDVENGWDILGNVKDSIHFEVGGIIQADGEGFSDEEGFHILWQFSDSAEGLWWMGVLRDGQWVHFQMDLGNQEHREAFFRGEVPDGVVIAE